MMRQQKPVRVFLSYAHEDRVWLEELEKHLSLLKRRELISLWSKRELTPGTQRAEIIDGQLERASLILLLVSADFLASSYCYEVEMDRALERHKEGKARVIPILVRPVNWRNAPFAHLEVLPSNGEAIKSWADPDEAFVDIANGIQRIIEEFPVRLTVDQVLLRTLKGNGDSDYARSTAWSPDGRQIASGAINEAVHLWDAETGVLLHTLNTPANKQTPVSSLAWSPDSKQLASSSYNGTVQVWDAETGGLLRTLEGHRGPVYSVAWSPDNRSIATASADKTILLWDTREGKPLDVRLKAGHTDSIRSLSWSPSNKYLASGANDNTVRVWDATSGEQLHFLKGHTNAVRLVAWSPDGRYLASGSRDGSVRVWNSQDGKLLNILEEHEGLQVCSVAWFPAGPLLASVAYDGSPPPCEAAVFLWHTETWKLLAVVRTLMSDTHSAWHPAFPLLAAGGQQKGDIDILNLEELID